MPTDRLHLKTFVNPELPETIYFDSSFVVKTLVEGLPYHQECMDFVRRLEEKQPIVVVSKISRPELWCAAIRICIRNLFRAKDEKKAVDIDKVLYDYPDLIKRFHKQTVQIQNDFDNLLQRFTFRVIEDVKDEILNKAQALMQKYNLGSYDAIHIATIDHWKMKDIAAFDHVIEDITDLNIWTCGGAKRHRSRWQRRKSLPAI